MDDLAGARCEGGSRAGEAAVLIQRGETRAFGCQPASIDVT